MDYKYVDLQALQDQGHNIHRLPFSIRVLLENAIRNKNDYDVKQEHVDTVLNWDPKGTDKEVAYKPARVLMQDFTGVPAVVDIAALRSEFIRKGKDGKKINPAIPVDLVIDHSVQVDYFGSNDAYTKNVAREYERNNERYRLLKWAQNQLDNFRVVPPGMGICHQVNLEYLAQGITLRNGWAFPDTLVGTDSHTPMVNGIGVVGYGVGGIEAEAALLGQPIFFTCPQVVGLKLTGKIPEGCTATDMVLTITRLLRDVGVVGKFVEVFGDGLKHLSVTDRATISNMSPEFGCTVTYFPIDDQTLDYMRKTNRPKEHIEMVEEYCKKNLLWRDKEDHIEYSQVVELDLNTLEPTVSGPKRPQDKILVKDLGNKFKDLLKSEFNRDYIDLADRTVQGFISEGGGGTEYTYKEEHNNEQPTKIEKGLRSVKIEHGNESFTVDDGSVTIAAITSCTNTSNPYVMIGAGLVAKKAVAKGLQPKPWVKTSLAPGSRVVTDYLERSGLLEDLEALSFHVVGYGCTSCIGNSGPLPPAIATAVDEGNLVVASVLSGNRNFEARVHPQVKMNFLMSPMLVVAYAIAGRVDLNLLKDPVGYNKDGEAVYLKDIWPTIEEINNYVDGNLSQKDFEETYSVIFDGDDAWKKLDAPNDTDYQWDDSSTYIHQVPFFKNISETPNPVKDIKDARVLLYLGKSVTTDHISPAGSFNRTSAAGAYLESLGVQPRDFNSYGSRRGNHDVMMRGTFANVRIKNKITDKEGGYSKYFPTGETDFVFNVAMKYKQDNTPLVILAGAEYGSGSSRDWAAKGTILLGVKAVIAESFERIHRSNLVCCGVLPLEFANGQTPESIGLTGEEKITIEGLEAGLSPHQIFKVKAEGPDGKVKEFEAKSRLDSEIEIDYYKNEGILQYVLRDFLKDA